MGSNDTRTRAAAPEVLPAETAPSGNGNGKAVAVRPQIDPRELGEILARSGYFKDAQDSAKAAVKVMAGQELGFGPVASMTGVHIIEGKPSVGGHLLAALVKKSRHYDYRIVELTDERCEIQFYALVAGEWEKLQPTSIFTIEDARQADLLEKANWRRYPRNMLFWRSMANGVRFHAPDLTGGAPLYTPEELGADVDGQTGEPVAALEPPEPKGDAKREVRTITKARAAKIVDAAKTAGIDANRLYQAACTYYGENVGAWTTKAGAVDALRKLKTDQADRLEEWIGKKAARNGGQS